MTSDEDHAIAFIRNTIGGCSTLDSGVAVPSLVLSAVTIAGLANET